MPKLLDRVDTPADLKSFSVSELRDLADEVREELIDVVSETGGHLGSSLGVVELTVALHAVFLAPRDKIIWDVGHQCYPHKMLTGRRGRMRTLRQGRGLSGFTKRDESEYDPFGAAHASTSISAALGFAVGRDFGKPTGDVVAVIGDGAMTGGMAFEAMNHAGQENRRLVVVLNDNEMSIAPPVGAMSNYLSRLSAQSPLYEMDQLARSITKALPDTVRKGAERARRLVTGLTFGGTLFEELGFSYIGPIDGHDMDQLIAALNAAKFRSDGPVLIHASTVKGKGYTPAENSADKYHGVSKFDVASGAQKKAKANAPSYTSVFGETLTKLAAVDPDIVAVTAAMPSGTGVDIMERRFANRVFDVGLAEQHAVTFAAGMAASGLKPFCAIYSTFLQRAYDQIVHDVALQGLPVRFALDRAGLVGADGATHAGAYDISYLGNLPGMVVMAASDEAELAAMTATAAAYDDGPIAFRYPRGTGIGVDIPEAPELLEIGKGRLLQEGGPVAILSLGSALEDCRIAASALKTGGIGATLADARFAKPIDVELVELLAANHEALLIVEHGAEGGFGARVLRHLAEADAMRNGLKVRLMTLPDRFIHQNTPVAMYEDAGLSPSHIETAVLQMLVVSELKSRRA